MLAWAGCGGLGFDPVIDELGPFFPPSLISALSIPGLYDSNASLTADLLEVYLTSDRPRGQGMGGYLCLGAADADRTWSAPVAVSEVNSPAHETGFTVTSAQTWHT